MRLAKVVMVAALCAAPMIASAGFTQRDTIQSHSNAVAPTTVPEPGTLALLLAGVAGVVATRRRRRDKNDR